MTPGKKLVEGGSQIDIDQETGEVVMAKFVKKGSLLTLLKRCAIIIAIALITGLTVNHVQIGALWRHVEVHLVKNYAPLPVELDFVLQWQQQGKLIVDARSQDNYADGHIARAHSVPVADQLQLQAVVDCCIEGGQVLVYCSSTSCVDSFIVGEALFVAGFNQIYLYEAGFAGWQGANQPVSSVTKE